MKAEDLGINPETGLHSQENTWHEATAIEILADHIDAEHKISRWAFTEEFNIMLVETLGEQPISMRQSQHIIDHLIIKHHQDGILAKQGKGGGYWISDSKEEAEAFYKTYSRRGISGLVKATRGKRGVVVNIAEQLVFDFDERYKDAARPSAISTPRAVVTALMDKMPDKEHDDTLRAVGKKRNAVLMPREDFIEIRALSKKLSGLLEKIS